MPGAGLRRTSTPTSSKKKKKKKIYLPAPGPRSRPPVPGPQGAQGVPGLPGPHGLPGLPVSLKQAGIHTPSYKTCLCLFPNKNNVNRYALNKCFYVVPIPKMYFYYF